MCTFEKNSKNYGSSIFNILKFFLNVIMYCSFKFKVLWGLGPWISQQKIWFLSCQLFFASGRSGKKCKLLNFRTTFFQGSPNIFCRTSNGENILASAWNCQKSVIYSVSQFDVLSFDIAWRGNHKLYSLQNVKFAHYNLAILRLPVPDKL